MCWPSRLPAHKFAAINYQGLAVLKTAKRHATGYAARMERLDESQTEFEAILRLDPNSLAAKQALDAIKARKAATAK